MKPKHIFFLSCIIFFISYSCAPTKYTATQIRGIYANKDNPSFQLHFEGIRFMLETLELNILIQLNIKLGISQEQMF